MTQSGEAGHVLVVYDADNPAFGADGFGHLQWDTAVTACRCPGLLRKVSWQAQLAAGAEDGELIPTMADIQAKYFGGIGTRSVDKS